MKLHTEQLMKRLVKASENLQAFEQLQETAEDQLDAVAEAASDAADAISSALSSLGSSY